MKKILYVNGCSHAAGAEISYKHSNRDEYDLTHSWGGIIASKYNLEYINDATSGNSNAAIVSSTICSLMKLLTKYNPSEIMVIIGWTSFDRSECIYQDKIYKLVPACDQIDSFKSWPKPVQDAYYSLMHTTDFKYNMNKFTIEYLTVSNFCKNNNIDYYFFNGIHTCYNPNINLLSLDKQPNMILLDMIKHDQNYLDPYNIEMTYFEYLKKRYDPCENGRWYHFGENAHKEWATILQDAMKPLITWI